MWKSVGIFLRLLSASRLALRADLARKILPISEALMFEANGNLFIQLQIAWHPGRFPISVRHMTERISLYYARLNKIPDLGLQVVQGPYPV